MDRLLKEKIIEPVSNSRWAAPIVAVQKANGGVRLCGDYRITANKAITLDYYPIPKIQDIFERLSGGTIFSKLDMAQAYAQFLLEEESKEITTINTHRGLFRYTRMPYGISCAPSIFQRCMESLLKDLAGVVVFFDDIVVSGRDTESHNKNLQACLNKLQSVGLTLNKEKCKFYMDEITYLGFKINKKGLYPTDEKIKALRDAPAPKNITELKSYLGMLNFYRKFLPSLSTVLEPLNKLLRSKVDWIWKEKQTKAFLESKKMILESKCLTHFNPELPIVVVVDSSPYGIGAVLNHKVGKDELPVCFISRTLNKAERNYCQLEKEALAIVYALKMFHQYLYGQDFKVVTDHKPLLGLFSNNKSIPIMASGRILRWSLMLQCFKWSLYHRSGELLGTADTLSRLPLPDEPESVPVPAEWINLVETLNEGTITFSEIKNYTAKDYNLSRVMEFLRYGWPSSCKDINLQPFYSRKEEISTQDGCVLWGTRIIVPEKLYGRMLLELHKEHLGSSRMKQLARNYIWWPGLDKSLEEVSGRCVVCLENRQSPNKAELHPWEFPSKPWSRIHVDYAGPVNGVYFLVIVDAFSKWPEIFKTTGPSSINTIKILRHCFAKLGLPNTLVSDNGTCFTSEEFAEFMKLNGIHHIKTAVYKPSTNGLAENMVKSFKSCLKKNSANNDIDLKINNFLFRYRITPHSTTGVTPSELIYGRIIRSALDLLHPSNGLENRVLRKQQSQKQNYDASSPRRIEIDEGSKVMIRNYPLPAIPKWIPATMTTQTGPLSYGLELDSGRKVKRHQDQIHVPAEATEGINPDIEPLRRSGRTVKTPDRLDL